MRANGKDLWIILILVLIVAVVGWAQDPARPSGAVGGGPDAPVVDVWSPANGDVCYGTVLFNYGAVDPDGLATLDLVITGPPGTPKLTISNECGGVVGCGYGYWFVVDEWGFPPYLVPGEYEVRAIARDTGGKRGQSPQKIAFRLVE